MWKQIVFGLLTLSLTIVPSMQHSAVSCTNKVGPTTCAGFPRYYHAHHNTQPLPTSQNGMSFFSSTDRQHILQTGSPICPESPLEEYTTSFPMANARPGQNLTIQHPPRGHAAQPSSPVWIFMDPIPNMYPSHKQPNANRLVLMAEYPFHNCIGLQSELSWGNCTGSVNLPLEMSPGVYTFVWAWSLSGTTYGDCFEVNITA